jgi:hypothetical protein
MDNKFKKQLKCFFIKIKALTLKIQDPNCKVIVKKNFNDSHQDKNMSKIKKFKTMSILVE